MRAKLFRRWAAATRSLTRSLTFSLDRVNIWTEKFISQHNRCSEVEMRNSRSPSRPINKCISWSICGAVHRVQFATEGRRREGGGREDRKNCGRKAISFARLTFQRDASVADDEGESVLVGCSNFSKDPTSFTLFHQIIASTCTFRFQPRYFRDTPSCLLEQDTIYYCREASLRFLLFRCRRCSQSCKSIRQRLRPWKRRISRRFFAVPSLSISPLCLNKWEVTQAPSLAGFSLPTLASLVCMFENEDNFSGND